MGADIDCEPGRQYSPLAFAPRSTHAHQSTLTSLRDHQLIPPSSKEKPDAPVEALACLSIENAAQNVAARS